MVGRKIPAHEPGNRFMNPELRLIASNGQDRGAYKRPNDWQGSAFGRKIQSSPLV